jgi:UDP-N-acetylmuramyl pentapeptide synthase
MERRLFLLAVTSVATGLEIIDDDYAPGVADSAAALENLAAILEPPHADSAVLPDRLRKRDHSGAG